MENRTSKRGENMKITYEELMTELEKHGKSHLVLTPEQERALVDAKDKHNVTFKTIAEVFTEKYGKKYNARTLLDKYHLLKKTSNQ